MDKTRLFGSLASQGPSELLDLLNKAYDEMKHDQRQAVFGSYIKTLPPAPADGKVLLDEVEAFRRESLAGVYYAPFACCHLFRHLVRAD